MRLGVAKWRVYSHPCFFGSICDSSICYRNICDERRGVRLGEHQKRALRMRNQAMHEGYGPGGHHCDVSNATSYAEVLLQLLQLCSTCAHMLRDAWFYAAVSPHSPSKTFTILFTSMLSRLYPTRQMQNMFSNDDDDGDED